MKSHINKKIISQNKSGTYIVLEAGPTHYGIESAIKLAKLAKEAGADAIKYQLLYADRLMADKTVLFTYDILIIDDDKKETYQSLTEPLYDILKRRELSQDEWIELKNYCDKINLTMFLTATYKDEVDFIIDELKVDSIKINSSDVNDLEFIRYCASKGVNIQLDTGNADLWEIEKAVIEAESVGCENIIIHLCPSGYPAHTQSINLNMLKTLKLMFPSYAIAFSDHSPDYHMDIAAVALGADMIEKTITLDRTIKSCEHSFSLDEEDMHKFISTIKEIEIALGSTRRTMPKEIKEKRKLGRRSPYALKTLEKGNIISDSDFEFKRPGYGITSEEFDQFIGKALTKTIYKEEILSYEYI